MVLTSQGSEVGQGRGVKAVDFQGFFVGLQGGLQALELLEGHSQVVKSGFVGGVCRKWVGGWMG